ncbi:MAG TPA: WYL domain-containing protein [Bacteroidia bacterium]|jgi:predicted DNA-binding transcriptional regulator YafY
MPANKEALARYKIIDSALRDKRKPYPTLEEIVSTCEEVLGKTFSKSTIQKDILALRFDESLNYNAPIEFSRQHGGYYYKDENYSIASIALTGSEIDAIEFAAGILEQFKGTDLYGEFDHAVEKILQTLSIRKILKNEQIEKIIQVEKASYFKGTQYLSELVKMIKQSQVITFDYHSFERDHPNKHILHPYLLKEYRNRWYLTGYHPEKKAIRTFGVDRIENIKASKEAYIMQEDFDPINYFKYSFGISTTDNKPEEVVLSFTPNEGKYIKNQTIHHTQEILKDTTKELRISIKVMVSYELRMQIMGYGHNVKVIKPASLAKEIKEMHEQAVRRYEE